MKILKTNHIFFALIVVLLGCDDIIEVEDISNRNVEILAPVANAVLTTQNVTFSWDGVEEANQYQLQIATPSFEEALQIVEDTTITVTNYTKTLELGQYEWRVRAENSGYQTEYTTQQFTIEE